MQDLESGLIATQNWADITGSNCCKTAILAVFLKKTEVAIAALSFFLLNFETFNPEGRT